jgi:hypothetical protein
VYGQREDLLSQGDSWLAYFPVYGQREDLESRAARAWPDEDELTRREALEMGVGQGIGLPDFTS